MVGLRRFHQAMIAAGREIDRFSYQNNQATLDVAFIACRTPFVLLIAARGIGTYGFQVEVGPRYDVDPFLGDHLGRLMDVLGVEYNPANPFKVSSFFRDLDRHAPRRVTDEHRPPTALIARLAADPLEEPEKVYFLKWLTHGLRESARTATEANLRKTRELLGSAAYRTCREYNISSCWTADPNEARPFQLPDPPQDSGTAQASPHSQNFHTGASLLGSSDRAPGVPGATTA